MKKTNKQRKQEKIEMSLFFVFFLGPSPPKSIFLDIGVEQVERGGRLVA